MGIETLQGSEVKVTVGADGVLINTASVITADIEGSNGVVHIIDSVLSIPVAVDAVAVDASPQKTIVELAQATDDLTTLVQAVIAASLVEALSAPGPFTVFAPTNDAFMALPAGTLAFRIDPVNLVALQDVLKYHV